MKNIKYMYYDKHRQRVRSHLLENQTVNNERLVVEVGHLFHCYLFFLLNFVF